MGFCKTFAKDVMNGGKIVLKGLKGPIGGFLITIAGVTVLAMNGVDISAATPCNSAYRYTPPAPDPVKEWDRFLNSLRTPSSDPDRLAEEGILKIAESSGDYTFDNLIVDAATKVKEIAMCPGSGYRAKSTAMNALGEMSSRCTFDNAKWSITRLIQEIATSL